jgi:chromate transporter
MREGVLWPLVAVFVPFSLVSIGGGPSIFAAIQHESVDVRHWTTAREFVDIFAISRAAPGPGSLLVTLIGWKAAGWAGAVTATLALYAPSSLLCFAIARVWGRYRALPISRALEAGLAPVGAGLIFAGILAIFRVADAGALSGAVALAAAAIFWLRPKLHPLLALAAGATLFAALSLAG